MTRNPKFPRVTEALRLQRHSRLELRVIPLSHLRLISVPGLLLQDFYAIKVGFSTLTLCPVFGVPDLRYNLRPYLAR